jgi:hypothetical protein
VRSGSGLLVLPGSRWAAAEGALEAVLPCELLRSQRPERPMGLVAADADAPGVGALGAAWRLKLGGARVTQFRHLRPKPDARTVLSLSNGLPAVVVRAGPGGRVMVCAFPLDRDWSDLCIHPTFVPLMQEWTRYLAGRSSGAEAVETTVGAPVRFRIAEDRGGAPRAVRPDGRRADEAVVRRGRGWVEYAGADVPGVYRLVGAVGEVLGLGVVNVDTRESDLRARDEAAVLAALRGKAAGARDGAASRAGTPLWPVLLWTAAALLVAESLLARR